jgi:hypothetical protein
MKFRLEIDLSNEAFDGADGAEAELGRILRDFAFNTDEGHPLERRIRDIDGNTVGKAEITED